LSRQPYTVAQSGVTSVNYSVTIYIYPVMPIVVLLGLSESSNITFLGLAALWGRPTFLFLLYDDKG